MGTWYKKFLLVSLLLSYGILSWAQDEAKNLSIGERFHEKTSLTWRGVVGDLFFPKPEKPPQYKEYSGVKKITLPKPDYRGMPLEEAIEKRRSVRNYSRKALSLAQLSQILFAAQGVTGTIYGHLIRSAPSAGALFPIEVYAVVNKVEGLSPGIYHYNVQEHALEMLNAGDYRNQITDAGLKQDMLGEANVTFVLSAIFDRTRHKYGERGFRYIYMEAGHISQNIYLQAVSLGLASVSVGAFLDDKVNQLIGIDGRKEAVIYLHAVGTL
ncbi:MAG: SagB/ThcOx family dehydrogenase [Pseudomonadota bacterium]